MNLVKKKYMKQLFENRIMQTDEEFDLFEEALDNLISIVELDDIPKLYSAFDDTTQDNEAMFRLVHLVETFDEQEAMDITVKAIVDVVSYAKNWMKILIRRILNSDIARKQFGLSIKKLDAIFNKKMIELLNNIQSENPDKFTDKIEEIL